MKKLAIITLPNRTINAGEYGASYGHNDSHLNIFEKYVKLPKSATSWTTYAQGVVEINIEYTGKTLGKRAMEEISRFIEKGFILEAEIGGQVLVEKPAQQPVIEEHVESTDFTAVSTDALISESKSLTETRLMQINGHISLTAEQIADVDVRGHAVAVELAKRFAEEEYHDPQYPRIEKTGPTQEAKPVVENDIPAGYAIIEEKGEFLPMYTNDAGQLVNFGMKDWHEKVINASYATREEALVRILDNAQIGQMVAKSEQEVQVATPEPTPEQKRGAKDGKIAAQQYTQPDGCVDVPLATMIERIEECTRKATFLLHKEYFGAYEKAFKQELGTSPTPEPPYEQEVQVATPEPYPTLSIYKDGGIATLWQQEASQLLASDPKLSPNRAGDLAAARIAERAGNEYAALEESLRGTISDEAVSLYDWLSENYDIKRDLITLSGTRTLIADMSAEVQEQTPEPPYNKAYEAYFAPYEQEVQVPILPEPTPDRQARITTIEVEIAQVPGPDDYAGIAAWNYARNNCNCPAYGAIECMAVQEGVDEDIADARYGACDCTCHATSQYVETIPIGDEYCWMHKPGGWCCPQCYYGAVLAAMRQAVLEVPSYCESQAAQFASEPLPLKSCSCGMTLCPACSKCHSIHCPTDGPLMSIECHEAFDALGAAQRGEVVLA